MFDLISMGELLVDFTPINNLEDGTPCFAQNTGGGPANLACVAAKYETKVALITKVGNDQFGNYLKQSIANNNVNTDYIILSDKYKTTIVFVHLDKNGERTFTFHRKNAADTMLRFDEIDLRVIDECKYLFLSSVMMAEGLSREMSFKLLEYAKIKGKIIVFDPNVRFNLWEECNDIKYNIEKALNYANIVKVSGEELEFITGIKDYDMAAKYMMEQFGIELLVTTLGGEGCCLKTKNLNLRKKGFKMENVIDTTGAGDAFTGAFISCLIRLNKDIERYTKIDMENAMCFANAVGALTTTKKGAIAAIPDLKEVKKLLELNYRERESKS